MSTAQDQEVTVEGLRKRLNEIAPAAPVTAAGLARAQAVEAQIAWARMMDMDTPITKLDIAIVQGCCAVAHALTALVETDPARADLVAAQIADTLEDGGSAGEWIYHHLGPDADEVQAIAAKMAALHAADKGTMYHESVTALRRSYAETAAAFEKVSDARFASAHAKGSPKVESEAYLGSLMTANFAYTLAAVLGEAAKFGPEVQHHLANLADNLITNGDDDDRNTDVMPAEPAAPAGHTATLTSTRQGDPAFD